MKGFKDSSNKFHPITQTKGVRKSRDQKAKQQGIRIERKAREIDGIDQVNSILPKNDIAISAIRTINELVRNKKFRTDPENITGKIDGRVMLDDYTVILNRIDEVERNSFGRGRVFRINNADFLELYLKRVARDAKEKGLLKNMKVDDLFFNAEFFTSREPDSPVLIRIKKNTTYAIAPFVDQEDLKKTVMKQVMKERTIEKELAGL